MSVIPFPVKIAPRRIGPGIPPQKRKHRTAHGTMNSAARKIMAAETENADFDGHDKILFEAANRFLVYHQIAPLEGEKFREALQARAALVKKMDYAAHMVLVAVAHAVRDIDLQRAALAYHDRLTETDHLYGRLMSTNCATTMNVYVGFDRVEAARILIKAAKRDGNTIITKVLPGLVMDAVRDGLRERRALAKKLASKTTA